MIRTFRLAFRTLLKEPGFAAAAIATLALAIGAAIAFVLLPFTPAGVPILAATAAVVPAALFTPRHR